MGARETRCRSRLTDQHLQGPGPTVEALEVKGQDKKTLGRDGAEGRRKPKMREVEVTGDWRYALASVGGIRLFAAAFINELQ